MKLKGGSGFKKDFVKPFDSEAVANNCARAWKVSAAKIIDLWDSKGRCASDFGTAIHNLLEAHFNGEEYNFTEARGSVEQARKEYGRLKHTGAKITEASKKHERNYAAPGHKTLRRLMKHEDNLDDQFIDILDSFMVMIERLGFTGESVQEPLVTNVELGMGGFIDRLYIVDKDKKICRVQDYKINHSATKVESKNKLSEEFSHLPSTKISGYTLQLNYYAFCLWKAGWEIEGLDVFVFDDVWEHYELEVFDFNWLEQIIRKYNRIN